MERSEKHAQQRVVENGVVYAVVDGRRKPLGFEAEFVLNDIRALGAETDALRAREAALDAEIADGAASVSRANAIGQTYRSTSDELAHTNERIAAGERRLADLRRQAAGGRN